MAMASGSMAAPPGGSAMVRMTYLHRVLHPLSGKDTSPSSLSRNWKQHEGRDDEQLESARVLETLSGWLRQLRILDGVSLGCF